MSTLQKGNRSQPAVYPSVAGTPPDPGCLFCLSEQVEDRSRTAPSGMLEGRLTQDRHARPNEGVSRVFQGPSGSF